MTRPPLADSVDRTLRELRSERIEAHLRFLAHPLLEGRGAGSRGGRLAEEYIRAVFAAAGLAGVPGFGHRQPVPMLGLRPAPNLSFVPSRGGTTLSPPYRDGYVLEAGVPRERVDVTAELIFAGFGIHAPEYGWDDYADLDVTGKVLLVRVNDPGTPERPDFFEGRRLTYYGRWTYKFEEAARRGAAGVLLIHTEESAGYGWNVVRSSNTGEQFDLAERTGDRLRVKGWITEEVAREVVAVGGADLDSLVEASSRQGFRAHPMGVAVRASVESTIREIETANVLAVVPGSDPSVADEPVILMAHHDHLGMSSDGSGPVIYPGAYDNASGVAVLLSIAQAMSAAGIRPRRPILFLASTAEESGLLGAEWYARNPAYPLARTAAVLNIDGANLQGPTRDIAPLGVDRSTLGAVVEAAALAEGLDLSPEQHPEKGMFFRQDHFPFVRAGVPAIAFDHGLRYRDRPEGWGEEWYREFIARDYHQPSDAFREDFDYLGAVQQGRVMVRTALTVADAEDLPDWLPGSTFHRPA